MGKAHSTHALAIVARLVNARHLLESVGLDRIMLKLMLRVWTGSIWLMVGTNKAVVNFELNVQILCTKSNFLISEQLLVRTVLHVVVKNAVYTSCTQLMKRSCSLSEIVFFLH
jgi:hypothetical protein